MQASYCHVIEAAVRAGQARLAITLCSEAHELGALRCYALPTLASVQPGTALGNAIDLRCAGEGGCGWEAWMGRGQAGQGVR